MKHTILISLLFSGLAVAVTPSQAQISNDEASANLLAAHCASSSGRSADNYREYGKSLALTLSFLSPEAQARVFQSKLPAVGNGETPAEPEPSTETADPANSGNESNGGLLEGLLGVVNGVNEALLGNGGAAESIIAGVDPNAPAVSGLTGNEPASGPASEPASEPVSGPASGPDPAFLNAFNEWLAGLSPQILNSTKKFKEAFKNEFNEEYEDLFHEPYKGESKEIKEETKEIKAQTKK